VPAGVDRRTPQVLAGLDLDVDNLVDDKETRQQRRLVARAEPNERVESRSPRPHETIAERAAAIAFLPLRLPTTAAREAGRLDRNQLDSAVPPTRQGTPIRHANKERPA
jgi:hypothetical protein